MAADRLRKFGAASQYVMRALCTGFIGADDVADAIGYVEYAGDPTNNLAPQFIGQECLDTANSAWYKAHGVAAADWKKLTP
jgi:hypothetical protein